VFIRRDLRKTAIGFGLIGIITGSIWIVSIAEASPFVVDVHGTRTVTPSSLPGEPTTEGTPILVTPPVPVEVDPHSNCLMCHSNPDFIGVFEDRSEFSLYVSEDHYARSVHGQKGLQCIACHPNITGYPHSNDEQVNCRGCHDEQGGNMQTNFVAMNVRLPYANKRALSLPINEYCRPCHETQFDSTIDSAHVKVLNGGNLQAPVCIDCHGSHDISSPNEPRTRISQTCSSCHEAVYSSYQSSIHGAGLELESNPDVPTCIDCHGVHSVRGPRDPSFRGDSIAICGRCHADEALMEKYGVSTEVFNSYLEDFHGRTVNLFREKGGLSSNKAVCFDCHGVHNIRAVDDPLSSVYPDNLQATCQQCHEEASIRFPQAWLSHYNPSWEKAPVLYGVNIAYKFLIVGTLGGFLLYIGLDARKRWSDRKQQQTRLKAIAQEDLDEYDFEKGSRQ
jgi:hypothetical protein